MLPWLKRELVALRLRNGLLRSPVYNEKAGPLGFDTNVLETLDVLVPCEKQTLRHYSSPLRPFRLEWCASLGMIDVVSSRRTARQLNGGHHPILRPNCPTCDGHGDWPMLRPNQSILTMITGQLGDC